MPLSPSIEKECAAKSGNVCSVVRLFSGGRYDLYQYRRYTDLRLVFAPEYAIAFFGRERDSISYLRYGLNIAFLRAYENGKPAATPDYLKWSAEGVEGGRPGLPRRAIPAPPAASPLPRSSPFCATPRCRCASPACSRAS